jgi:hypothetical protein
MNRMKAEQVAELQGLVNNAGLSSVKRVASAVGEGAMAVQFVHEYLKEV